MRELAVTGPRAADDVWDRYVRPRRWSEWSPQIRSVDCAAETISPGTTGVVHGPAGLRVHFQVLDVDASVRSWSWSVSSAGVRMRLWHTVQAVTDGTRTGLTVAGLAPAVLGYLPIARIALRRLVS